MPSAPRRARSSGGRWLLLLCVLVLGAASFVLFISTHLTDVHTARLDLWQRSPGGVPRTAAGGGAGRDRGASQHSGLSQQLGCAELLERTANIMFMIVGGRGYHDLRVRVILRSWAKCVQHTLVFTEPMVNLSAYSSNRKFVYLSAGDAWRRRSYLPMSHMDTLGKLIWGKNSPANNVSWFVLVSDRTFVNPRELVRKLEPLDPTRKGYYGQVANTTHKEAFGFHDYVDLNTGIVLSSPLLSKVTEAASCKDQKSGGGTFDMFDAKLGNCVFYLGAFPRRLRGFHEGEPPESCGAWLKGTVSYGKVEPLEMLRAAGCAGLLDPGADREIRAMIAAEEHVLEPTDVAVHVMARETKLKTIVDDCEATWAADVPKVYYHADKAAASESYTISRGRWAVSSNVAPGSSNGSSKDSSKQDKDSGKHDKKHRVAALNLPQRPGGGGEHWTISHDKGFDWNTWLRFKMKAIFTWSVRAPWSELQGVQWFVYVDDDTYVLMKPLVELLRHYDPSLSHYFGRPLQEEGYPIFVGGGAGIVLSRGAAMTILAAAHSPDCDPLHLKWLERTHQESACVGSVHAIRRAHACVGVRMPSGERVHVRDYNRDRKSHPRSARMGWDGMG